MSGYWNRPELNAQRSRGGWHHTNDLGRYEADGSFTFVGPKTRMLKSAAENIYPVEVENCLKAHPAVADCAVIGVPDETWVQSVKAIVVLRAGAVARRPTSSIEHCQERIASYKKPRSSSSSTRCRARGFAVDYDALDAASAAAAIPAAAPDRPDPRPRRAGPPRGHAVRTSGPSAPTSTTSWRSAIQRRPTRRRRPCRARAMTSGPSGSMPRPDTVRR